MQTHPLRTSAPIAIAFAIVLIGATRTTAVEPSRWAGSSSLGPAQTLNTVLFPIDNQWLTGLHLLDSSNESLVMGRDGWLHTLPHDGGRSPLRLIDKPFEVASATEMRNALKAEYGRRFDVVATRSFLVVQPLGRGDRWPEMFEKSHRSFVDTMRRRGVSVREGRFPMVAVVMPDARAMYDEFDRLKLDVSRVSGLYANRCNRVITHDGGQFDFIAATVRHEAAHQSAFNTGVHSRVNDTPSWVTEGIGQMFEPAAIASGQTSARLADRLNRESIDHLRETIDLRDVPTIARLVDDLVTGDEMFKSGATIHTAYSLAWAMMFYLSERQPADFAEMLNFTATRPPFETYRPGQRRIDFERIVGTDVRTFAGRLSVFLAASG